MKKILFIIVWAFLAGVFFVSEEPHSYPQGTVASVRIQPELLETVQRAPNTVESIQSAPDRIDASDKPYTSGRLERILLDVPFQPQAPFRNWSEPWQEACEEASLVLANRFAHGTQTLTREEMRDEIARLVDFQNRQYGDYKDSDAARTAAIGRAVYGLAVEVREIEGAGDMRKILEEGKLIIAPMAGRELNNPYFTPPGPLYHMLVIRGYDDATGEFITHDVGTRRGEGMRYPYDVIWNALHDFPGDKERILEGRKAVIVVSR